MRTLLALCAALLAGACDPLNFPIVAIPSPAEVDTASTVTEYTPHHPFKAVWGRRPTPAMREAWAGATHRWGGILVANPSVGPVVVAESHDPCLADIFGLGAELEPLTVAIVDAGPGPGAYAASCGQGIGGIIAVGSDWWGRGSVRSDSWDMEVTLAHEIGHILGIGEGWKTFDDQGRITARGGWWGSRVTLARSTVLNDLSSPPDTVDWPYLNDPAIAETLEALTGGEWEGDMIPLDDREQHWHWCLAPPVGCRKPTPNGCEGVKYGGDVMGPFGSGGITSLTLEALDPSVWIWAPAAAEAYGEPDESGLRRWRASRLSRCPRPL